MKVIKTIGKVLLILVLLVVLLLAGVRAYAAGTARGRILDIADLKAQTAAEEPLAAVLVLGASVYRDGTPSPVLKNRLDTAKDVYDSGAVTHILVSGDHVPGDYDETDNMAAYLERAGVESRALILDYEGFSTGESVRNLREKYGITKAVIVTQEYHLPRALMLADAYGIEAYGVAAPEAGGKEGRLKRELREWPACVKDLAVSILIKTGLYWN